MKNLSSRQFNRLGMILLLLLTCAAFSEANAQESEAEINARITALTAKINAAPKDDSFYDQRGMAYFALRKLDEALADVNIAIGINPKNTNALFIRGQIKGIKKDYDGAIVDYTAIINIYPKPLIRVHLKRGEMYEIKGDKEKARADYARALEISPQNVPATEALARVGSAAKTVNPASTAKTVEVSQNDNKQNPVVTGITVVSSLNRLNFYAAVSLEQTSLLAEQISMFGNKDREMANSLLAKVKVLYAVLKGRTEAEDLAGAAKRLQQSNNIKEFTSDLIKIHSKYRASLANEQKWYFDIGYNVANIQFGIASKNHFLFIGKNEDFSKLVKLLPAGTPLSLQTSLKDLSQFANNNDLSAVNSDSDYAKLEAQIKPIFDSVGQLKNEDKSATSSGGALTQIRDEMEAKNAELRKLRQYQEKFEALQKEANPFMDKLKATAPNDSKNQRINREAVLPKVQAVRNYLADSIVELMQYKSPEAQKLREQFGSIFESINSYIGRLY